MKKPIESANYFFVDESGDPTFFDRYGNLIVGQEGCSPVLILGFIETTNPGAVRHALAELHRGGLPPMNISKRRHPSANRMWRFTPKTIYRKYRQAVFKCIKALEFKAQFVVARKIRPPSSETHFTAASTNSTTVW